MIREIISTKSAPSAIGPYSQAIRAGSTVYLSGQIALDPETGHLVEGGFDAQGHRAFRNLRAVAEAAGGSLAHCVKLTLFVTELTNFPRVNDIMQEYFAAPYPARTTVTNCLPPTLKYGIEVVAVRPGD